MFTTAAPLCSVPEPKSSIQFSADCMAYVSTFRAPPVVASVFTWPVQVMSPLPPKPQVPVEVEAWRVLKRPGPPLPEFEMYIVDQDELLFRNTPAWLSSAVPSTPIAHAGETPVLLVPVSPQTPL